MKGISSYISEKLKFSRDFHPHKATYAPKDRHELMRLLKELIDKRGQDADLNDIDVSQIYSMAEAFSLVQSDVRHIDVSEWDMSHVDTCSEMFLSCQFLECDLSNWDMSNVRSMDSMFTYCTNFNSDITGWDVSRCENFHDMFMGCTNFNQDLSKWDMSKVRDLDSMFYGCKSFDKDLTAWGDFDSVMRAYPIHVLDGTSVKRRPIWAI